jgi:hypothetical protein
MKSRVGETLLLALQEELGCHCLGPPLQSGYWYQLQQLRQLHCPALLPVVLARPALEQQDPVLQGQGLQHLLLLLLPPPPLLHSSMPSPPAL